MEAELTAAIKAGVRVMACGVSLDKHKINRAKLVEGLEFVDNGLLETLHLQTKGWLSVEL